MKLIMINLFFLTALFGFEAQSYVVHKNNYEFKDGWYWGKEVVENNQTKQKKEYNYKISPDRKKQLNVLDKINENLEKQNELLKKIVSILDYSFPQRFPKYTKNKKTGQKCIANSSADCFVMPLTAEAQQLPILGNLVRNPNANTAKKWLKWYARYLQQASNVGFALHFTSNQYGRKVYPTNSDTGVISATDHLLSSKRIIKKEVVKKVSSRMRYYLFYGKSKSYESILNPVSMLLAKSRGLQSIKDFTIVYYDKTYKNNLEKYFNEHASKREKNTYYNETKKIVSKKLFKKYSIDQSPLLVMIFKDKKGKEIFWQKVAYGFSPNKIISETYDFLLYNNIIKPDNLSSDNAAKGYNGIYNSYTNSFSPQEKIDVRINKDKDFQLKISDKQKIQRR